MERTQRYAARVLLVNDKDEVLLFRGFDPAAPEVRYWFTPGGGLDPGEPIAECAARELREETGLVRTAAEMGEPVHADVTLFSFDGVHYRQEQQFFLVRVGQWQVDTTEFDAYEAATIDESRWWSLSSLEATTETFYPRDLVAILRGLVGC